MLFLKEKEMFKFLKSLFNKGQTYPVAVPNKHRNAEPQFKDIHGHSLDAAIDGIDTDNMVLGRPYYWDI